LNLLFILQIDQALRVLDFQAHFHLSLCSSNRFQEIAERSDSEESSVASTTSAVAIVPSGKLSFTRNIKLKATHKVNTCFFENAKGVELSCIYTLFDFESLHISLVKIALGFYHACL